MSGVDLDELERLRAAGTPGQWGKLTVDVEQTRRDAALIVAAVNALPALIARVRKAESERDAARAEVERLRRRLARIEDWSYRYGSELCPRPRCADTFGDGIRTAKQEVLDMCLGKLEQKP